MTCDCIEQMDAKLAPHNMRLATTFAFGTDGTSFTRVKIGTEKINSRKKEAALAYPTYCPFCGIAYKAGNGEKHGG